MGKSVTNFALSDGVCAVPTVTYGRRLYFQVLRLYVTPWVMTDLGPCVHT